MDDLETFQLFLDGKGVDALSGRTFESLNPYTGRRDIAIGVFEHREKAEAAISELQAAGFAPADIGVAARNDKREWGDYETVPSPEKGAHVTDPDGAALAAGGAAPEP